MFKAKSKQLMTLSAHQLLVGDIKNFKFKETSIAFGVVETVDLASLVTRTPELYDELRAFKKEQKLTYAFLALVDIVNLRSLMVICGPAEKALAEHVFGGSTDLHLLSLGKRVSRKKDFIAPISQALADGFVYSPSDEHKDVDDDVDPGEVYMDCTNHGCVVRRRLSRLPSTNSEHLYVALGRFRYSGTDDASS